MRERDCQYLTKAYPKHEIIAEESTDKETLKKKLKNDAEYTWLIDPIDGTKNFIHDFPFYSVSIGLLRRKGSPLLFMILIEMNCFAPLRDEVHT